MKRSSLILSSLFLSVSLSLADTTVVVKDNRNGDATTQTMFVADGKFVVSMDDGERKERMVFDSNSGAMTVINDAKQEKIVMTAEGLGQMMDKMQGQMAAAMKQFEAQIAQLPPAQQALMRERMKATNPFAGQADAGPKPELKDTGRTESVNGKSTRLFEKVTGGVKEADYYVVSFNDAGIPAEDAVVFQKFGEFMEKMMEKLPAGAGPGAPAEASVLRNGTIPWKSVNYENGAQTWTSEVLSVDNSPIAPAKLAIPDYKTVDPFSQR